MGQRRINRRGLELIKEFEGLRLISYQDIVGIWTVGYGHTGPDVKPNQVITETEAEAKLLLDLDRTERGVDLMTTNPSLTENQFSAMVSLAFNVGLGNLKSSTLLKYVNQNRMEEAANEFPKWNKAGGKAVEGLTRRRLAEKDLFLS